MTSKSHNLLKSIKNPDWWVQKTTGVPHIIYYAANACTVVLRDVFPITCDRVFVFCKDEHLEWVYEENDLARVGAYLVNQTLKDSKFVKRFYRQWKLDYDAYIKFCKMLSMKKLSSLDDNAFFGYYKKFTSLYEHEYSLSMLCDHFSFYAERQLKEKLSQEEFITLTTPSASSFINEEELSLLKIYQDYKNQAKEINIILTKKYLKKLDDHVDKYFWILNTYKYPVIVDKQYFKNRLKDWQKENIDFNLKIKQLQNYKKTIKNNKQIMLAKLKLGKRTKLIIELIDIFAEIHNLRKQANLMASYYVFILLKDVSIRTKISLEDLKYVMPTEIENIFNSKAVNKKVINARKSNWVICYVNGRQTILQGKLADNLHKEIFKSDDKVAQIKGIVASPGKVRGYAKIVFHSTQANKMKKGDILVASMTRPDYINAIRKAAAIVTDEGGVTCHAAIVSRELNIPCIIATKNATRMLQDGDEVEVDADNGIVKKII